MTEEKNPIMFYEREFYPLSNFSSFQVFWNETTWMTSEHAYQASKFSDPSIIQEIQNALSAHDAKKIVEKYQDRKRSDWKDVKLSIMEEILRAKLSQHVYIQKKLMETGDKEIIEDSPEDSFWGWGSDKKGQNQLGKIWMKIRKEVKNG